MECLKCKKEIALSAKFCNHCGSIIEILGKTCTNTQCGRIGLPKEAVFCPDCGTKLNSSFASFIETAKGISFDMVAVNGGTFMMGSNDDEDNDNPIHRVRISNFLIGKTEVTQAVWQVLMGNNPSFFKGRNLPVEQVSWNDSQMFINELNLTTGKNYRLPTEAEWEYAARGGNNSKTYRYSGSNNIREVAYYKGNNDISTKPVGRRKPNELGLYDMSGNVSEWCNDWYDTNYYVESSENNPPGPSSGIYRVFRGGCWYDDRQDCCIESRSFHEPDFVSLGLGFRLSLIL